jgi:hypothetical protein
MSAMNPRRAGLALACGLTSVAALAAPGSDSPYRIDSQTSYVHDATSSGIGEVNMIACIMAAMRPDALVNDGPYIALIDKNKCDSDKRSSSSNSAAGSEGAQAAASYITATVNSTRASNSDPMVVKSWLELDEEDMHMTVHVHIAASEAPTPANPYGVFRLDFCGRTDGVSGCLMNGFVDGANSGLSFFESEGDGNDGRTVAMRLATAGATGGNGRMSMEEGNGQAVFAFAYDASLFRRDDEGGNDQCFSRDASDPDTGLSVWRYGLYDVNSGERVTRNSGFPIDFTTGGTTYHGFLGYYGLSLPPEANDALENGDTVAKVDYSTNTPTRTDYTVVKSEGKLIKYTKKTRTLNEMDQIRFSYFVDNNANAFFAGAQPNSQYEVLWDEASGVFIAVSQMNCSQNGCQTQALPQPEAIALGYFIGRGGIQAYSQALGGEIFIDLQGVTNPVSSSTVQVVYRAQDLVYPSQMPATLYCLQNCPTAASMQSFFTPGSVDPSPYLANTFQNFMPTAAGNEVVYGTDAATVTLRDNVDAAVVLDDGEALRERGYAFGLRSGRLFTNLAAAECSPGSNTYCDWKVSGHDTYYVWETGPSSWNQFAAVKDGSGNFVEFDPPLQLNYDVPVGAAYGEYSGKKIVLQYGGFGDLWGIPGYCVSGSTNEVVDCSDQNSRYVPSFVIPMDEVTGRVTDTSGTTSYLVKWLDREIRFAQKPLATCSAAGLNVPANVTLPTTADLRDPSNPASNVYVGTKPVVTDAPRVIHGEVKF